SRWLDNENRTRAYLRFVDVERLLYNFRANHRLSTNGAAPGGGSEEDAVEDIRTLSNSEASDLSNAELRVERNIGTVRGHVNALGAGVRTGRPRPPSRGGGCRAAACGRRARRRR
ncbi:hypothetical protein E1283_27840, partial [Streptomyces hainanensis]